MGFADQLRRKISFKNFDENEETTVIKDIVLLRVSLVKSLILVPILSLLTCFIFALVLYWYPRHRAKYIYSVVEMISEATHVAVTGISKSPH